MLVSWLRDAFSHAVLCSLRKHGTDQIFSPADALVETLMEIDYKKHFNTFMDGVEVFCLFVAAIATVIAQKWQQHNMTERTQLFVLQVIEHAKTFWAWINTVFVPGCKELYNDFRSVYNFVRTV